MKALARYANKTKNCSCERGVTNSRPLFYCFVPNDLINLIIFCWINDCATNANTFKEQKKDRRKKYKISADTEPAKKYYPTTSLRRW